METGLCGFNIKSDFKKPEIQRLIYRDYKDFSNQQFQTDLIKKLSENNIDAS